ncbi:MAG: ankyrin repeat domain-containing protein, partial [Rhodospirillaceae bacterium]|nr:ankyrin repeat domain-containing protein [Rhodospirillaceae bacterium]
RWDAAYLERIVDLLLSAGVQVEARDGGGRTPLHVAAASDNAMVAKALIDAGAQVEARDKRRGTPLHAAARVADLDWAVYDHLYRARSVKVLLAAGATTDARDRDGRTPLQAARASGNAIVEKALLDALAGTGARE